METRRRRGPALEAAILDAAWEELAAVGYARLTMEGVAARARTGKQVLYRRWRGRPELVIAALRHHTGSIADRVPDTGSLRGDVLAVLRRIAERQREIGPDVIHGLMAEAVELDPEFFGIMRGVLTTVLEQAGRRGEISPDAVGPRVVTLPADLLRHELLLTRKPVADRVVTEIVDEVFLPLVRATAGRGGTSDGRGRTAAGQQSRTPAGQQSQTPAGEQDQTSDGQQDQPPDSHRGQAP